MLIIVTILLAALTMLLLSIVMGYILGWANRAFHVEIDPRIEQINQVLPGANCAGCGYIGCMEYAEAVVKDGAAVNKCPVGGESCAALVAKIMGVELEKSYPYRAVIHCSADYDGRLKRQKYLGEPTCGAANVVSGVQGCTYGCLGFGDCSRACPYDAIYLEKGLAYIDYEKCVGCGACVKACPRKIISLVPFKSEKISIVACANKDSAKEVREVCLVGCIGCRACSRIYPSFKMEGNIARLDYDAYEPDMETIKKAMEKCPRSCMIFVGKPTKEEKEAVKNEEVKEPIEAKFDTTVDRTQWHG